MVQCQMLQYGPFNGTFKTPVLSGINKKNRLQWARLHANWTAQDWSKVSTMMKIIKYSSGDN